ncbi:MAG: aminotransferase class I/II-fold pyridoxal phosphate-dependent enzyme [Clostridia bacterium]|nr:aminotransferase class I/II-fold pyridoxal phosphate-dependent enzyme [Clostridia bacterium]
MDYSEIVSERAYSLQPSGIRKYFDMLAGRKDVIGLTVGQPDFDTPWHIVNAGIESLRRGKTYYTGNAGLAELRRETAAYLNRRFSVPASEDEIIITVGGSEAIDLAFRAMLNPGDEVIIPQPCFVCYGPLVSMADGVPVYIRTREADSFKLTPEALEAAVTPKTKLLVLPYPANPTGAIMTREELLPIAEICRRHGIFVLSDEIYAELTFNGRRHCSISSLEGMKERTIVVSGFSKAYAMTGWRIGYSCAPAEITKQMLKIHQYGIMCASTTSQYAALEALREGDGDIAFMASEYDRRRRMITDGLRSLGIPCFEPEGAFYIFPNVGVFGLSSEEFCSRLLNESGVAIIPGTAFGECGEGFARISYAYSIDHILKALDGIGQFLRSEKLTAAGAQTEK